MGHFEGRLRGDPQKWGPSPILFGKMDLFPNRMGFWGSGSFLASFLTHKWVKNEGSGAHFFQNGA